MLKREEAIETLKIILEDLESIYPWYDDYTPHDSQGPNCGLRGDNKALTGLHKVLDFLES